MERYDYVVGNLASVSERIAAACRRVRRAPEDVLLVAVCKTAPAAAVLAAYGAGARHFGENRVEDALPKIAAVGEAIASCDAPPVWHMIGHLQSRKVRDAMPAFDMVQSVDTVSLAREMSKRLAPHDREMPILLEVNSGEEYKYGFAPADLPAAVEQVIALPWLSIRGLMTMAPMGEAPDDARPAFRALRALRDEMARRFPSADWGELSMGMTDDFEPAVEEGATMLRIGRAIFEPRTRA